MNNRAESSRLAAMCFPFVRFYGDELNTRSVAQSQFVPRFLVNNGLVNAEAYFYLAYGAT